MRLTMSEVQARTLQLLAEDAALVAAGGPIAGGKTRFAASIAAAVAADGHGGLLVGQDDPGVAALEDALSRVPVVRRGIASTIRLELYSEESPPSLKRSTDLVVFDDAHRYQPAIPARTGPRTVWVGELGTRYPARASGSVLEWRETRMSPKIADWISRGRYQGAPLTSVWRPPYADLSIAPPILARYQERTLGQVVEQCEAAVDYMESITGDKSFEVGLALIGRDLRQAARGALAHARALDLDLLGCDRPRSVVIGMSEPDDDLLARYVGTARENVCVVTLQGLHTPLLDLLPDDAYQALY